MKLLGLIRISAESGATDEKAGIPRQRADLETIARREGCPIEILEVVDVSGTTLGHSPHWRSILVRLEDGDTHIAVQDTDRLLRPKDFDFKVYQDLVKTKTRVYSPSGCYDPRKPNDQFMMTILAAVAGIDRVKLLEKMHGGKEAKRRRGEWVQPIRFLPTGISFDRPTRTWGFTPEAEIVKGAYRMLVNEGRPIAAIARVIGKTPAGTREMLRNSIYQGILTFDEKRGDAYVRTDGKQPDHKKIARAEHEIIRVRVYSPSDQLVSDDVWDAAQAILDRSRQTNRKLRETGAPDIWASSFMTSGLSHNDTVGFRMLDLTEPNRHVLYGAHRGESEPTYYRCRCTTGNKWDKLAPKVKCGLPWFAASALNGALDAALVKLTADQKIKDHVLRQIAGDKRDVEGDRKRLTKSLDAIYKKESKLVDLFMDGGIDRAMYGQKRAALQDERTVLQKSLDALADMNGGPDPAAVKRHLDALRWDSSWSSDQKRSWLAANVASIVVCPEGFRSIVLRLPGRGAPTVPVELAGTTVNDGDVGATVHGGHWWTWDDLVGFDIRAPRARLRAQGMMTTGQVAEQLGLRRHQLQYLVRSGQVPAPSGKIGDKMTWTETEVAAVKQALAG